MRPRILKGKTYRIQTPAGRAYITLNKDNSNELSEIIVKIGKSGDQNAETAEVIGKLATELLRCNCPPERIAKKLRFIKSGNPIWDEGKLILSISDAVGIVIKEYLEQKKDAPNTSGNPPPEV